MEPQVTKEFHLPTSSGCQVSILELRGTNAVQLILLDYGGVKHTATLTEEEFRALGELRWHISWNREPKPEPAEPKHTLTWDQMEKPVPEPDFELSADSSPKFYRLSRPGVVIKTEGSDDA